ncbi:hypothetical protein Gohar_006410 [Gossypium harknessii]|uniref:RNase H type-1 domain-containing protein n=2 Tax=Gossypium harknessii TaxID=34285 RepID=A0A7J9GDB6_9ROSI|nr:hypothetical protein [Gossypium harknessii]
MEQMACKLRIENSWQRPKPGWVKINIDGWMSTSRQRAAIGGALKGPIGGWLVGFEMVTSMASIFQIEAQPILKGLKLAWMRGFIQVEVESNNALLIDTIRNNFAANKSNKVDDCSAKTIGGRMNQLVVLVDPPSYVRRLLEEDIDSSMQVRCLGSSFSGILVMY